MVLTLRKRTRDPRNDPHAPAFELDRELAGRIARGDREALALLVDRHICNVYKHVMRCLGPVPDALVAEIVRATFTDAVKHVHAYASGRTNVPLRLWLLRRANHHIARRRAKLRPYITKSEEGADSPEVIELRRAMFALPPRHAAALSSALFEAASPEELKYILGGSSARAMRLLRCALKRLSRMGPVEEAL